MPSRLRCLLAPFLVYHTLFRRYTAYIIRVVNTRVTRQKSAAVWLTILSFSLIFPAYSADDFEVIQLYTQDELNTLIEKNQHLQRVKADECQLVEDIKARAEIVKLPTYQFLWGDMLAWKVCVERDVEQGIYYMRQAAAQGLPAALEQLGRYYQTGTLVQKDLARAIPLLRESAQLGFLPAQLRLVEIYSQGKGSPYDYEDAYRWLHNAVIGDKKTHQKAARLLAALAEHMPPHIVKRAKLPQR